MPHGATSHQPQHPLSTPEGYTQDLHAQRVVHRGDIRASSGRQGLHPSQQGQAGIYGVGVQDTLPQSTAAEHVEYFNEKEFENQVVNPSCSSPQNRPSTPHGRSAPTPRGKEPAHAKGGKEPEQRVWRGFPGFPACSSLTPSAVHPTSSQHKILGSHCFFRSSILPWPIKLIKLNECVCFLS